MKTKLFLLLGTIIWLVGCVSESTHQPELASPIVLSDPSLIIRWGVPPTISRCEPISAYLDEYQPSYVTNVNGDKFYTKNINEKPYRCYTLFILEGFTNEE